MQSISSLQRGFGRAQKVALGKTLDKMRQMGILDSNLTTDIKLESKRAVELFELYYWRYLEQERKVPMPTLIGQFL